MKQTNLFHLQQHSSTEANSAHGRNNTSSDSSLADTADCNAAYSLGPLAGHI